MVPYTTSTFCWFTFVLVYFDIRTLYHKSPSQYELWKWCLLQQGFLHSYRKQDRRQRSSIHERCPHPRNTGTFSSLPCKNSPIDQGTLWLWYSYCFFVTHRPKLWWTMRLICSMWVVTMLGAHMSFILDGLYMLKGTKVATQANLLWQKKHSWIVTMWFLNYGGVSQYITIKDATVIYFIKTWY